ncbi:hypothetical protein Tco_0726851 [Tanacetum coccineum]|uniref:Uncharacterized protein n=1 Tax=Tanacetum coccineum TaxID=301880 RepID=A0ABQ4YHP7_9ASTR
MVTFMDWFCKQRGISALTPKDLEGPAFEIVKVFHPDVIHLQFQMEECHKFLTDQVDDAIIRYNVSKPLPLGGELGHVTIQPDFFFNKDLEYLRYGRKVGRPALSISKMKAAYYPDVGLEQLVPDQFWIEEECKYDIAAMYGDRRAVRTHMRILSVVRIEVFSMYGYNYMKKIVLRRADLKEYIIAERDFSKTCTPVTLKICLTPVEDFSWNESYHIKDKPHQPRWGSTGFWEFKHDYTVIDSPRAVTFRDRYGVQMIMRFNEIHKFSDGTLQQIDEALDYRVKEFQINRTNPGMNTRFWTKKDVDRSKDFMFAIQKRLKTRRIFRNLESFVGGRIREGDYRNAYEKCTNISQESRALIDNFLKEDSDKDYELNLSMYEKAAKLEKQMDAKLAWLLEKFYYRSQESVGCSSSQADLYLTEKELHQLYLDEEALRETLEEQAMDAKVREKKIRQKQADDDEFFLEFGMVRIDSDYESSD